MILSAKSTGRLSRLHGSRRGARTRTANGSHDQLVATISLPMAVYGAFQPQPAEGQYALVEEPLLLSVKRQPTGTRAGAL